jgi:aryl-alcohol dehydrogenase-like predicted oxidoreductase
VSTSSATRFGEPAARGLSASGRAVIAFGAWGIGGEWGAPTAAALAHRTVERALELGVIMFDTAPTYGAGRSEQILGDVLSTRREAVVLATKCGPLDDPRASLEGSLHRLRTDYVDLLQLHEIPSPPGALERQLVAMNALVDAGLARAIGICNATPAELARAGAVAPIAMYQGQLNLIDRDARHALLPVARARAIGFIAYRPLASGMLSGKFHAPPTFERQDHRARIHWFRDREFARRRAVVERLTPIAHDHGMTVAQLAIGWVLAQPGVIAVLAGARSPAQVEENTAARPLSPEMRAAVDAVVAAVYAPRALRGGVRIAATPDPRGEYRVSVERRNSEESFAVGAREAHVMTRLDGRTPYDEIAAAWRPPEGRPMLAAQVVLLVDQLADLGLLEES